MNYGRMKSTTDKLLYKMGMPVTLSKYESITGYTKGYDEIENRTTWTDSEGNVSYTAPSGAPTIYTGYGVRVSYKQNEIDGTNIQRGDIKLVLSTDFPEPQDGDKFMMDSVVYNYVNHEVKAPSITELVYFVQVRK